MEPFKNKGGYFPEYLVYDGGPLDEDGNNLTTTSKKVKAGTFKGFINHFHVTKSKIDCAGLDIKKLLNEIK